MRGCSSVCLCSSRWIADAGSELGQHAGIPQAQARWTGCNGARCGCWGASRCGTDCFKLLLGSWSRRFVLVMNMFNPLFTASSFAGIFVALFMAMWILPILPLLIRPNYGQPNRTWLSLDADSGIENTASIENSSLRSQWRLTFALAIGASIVFGLAHLLMRVSARALFSESVRGSEEFLQTFYSATFIMGALFQCGLAIIVALVANRLGVTHALVADVCDGAFKWQA